MTVRTAGSSVKKKLKRQILGRKWCFEEGMEVGHIKFIPMRDAFLAMLQWEYYDYTDRCAWRLDQQYFAEMAFECGNIVVYEQICQEYDTAVEAYMRLWKTLGWACAGILLGFEVVDISSTSHSDKLHYVRRLEKWLKCGLVRPGALLCASSFLTVYFNLRWREVGTRIRAWRRSEDKNLQF